MSDFKIPAEYVNKISRAKKEPKWMLNFRLKALETFNSMPMPKWGPKLDIDFAKINYFKPWKEAGVIDEKMREYFDKLGISKAEQKFLTGVEVQYDSSVVYAQVKKRFLKQGVIFTDTDTALQKYPQSFKKYFGKIVPYTDNKFAALNSAFWSGGSFIYVPKGVHVTMPIHAFFVIQSANIGQFERTLIIVEDGASVEYLEGCTVPLPVGDSLHAAVVEIYVGKGAKVKYSTFQNWRTNVYNLVTKRAKVEANGQMEWVDINIGSKITMKYPACILAGENSKGAIFSLSVAKHGQNQDTGTKMIHFAPNTHSVVITKAIGQEDGISEYRGLIFMSKEAKNSSSNVSCDALLLSSKAKAGTKPVNRIFNTSSKVYHEATVSQVDANKLYFLQSRGLSGFESLMMLVLGFTEDVKQHLPLEFALEFNKLMEIVLSDE